MISGTATSPPAPATTGPAVRVVAWVLVGLWLVVTVMALVSGTRESTYADLRRDLRVGAVTEVTVVGGLPTGARGNASVELEWRDGWFLRRASIVEQRPARQGAEARRTKGSAVVEAPVAERLRELQPGVVIAHRDFAPSGAAVWGIPVPGWLFWVFLAAMVGTLTMLVATPDTGRATRWGWFWLLWTLPPVGLLAFLLLGGPTARADPPAGSRRLGGGWAFLLFLVLGGSTVLGSTLV